MPEYNLVYFDSVRAVAEPLRWMFKAAKVPFQDERLTWEEWVAIKNTSRFPLGQIPILEVDGETLTQSYSIGRYLAKQFGFVNDDPLLTYRAEQVSEIIEDCRRLGMGLIYELLGDKDPAKIEEHKQNMLVNIFPKHFRQLESIVKGTEGAFITGHHLLTHGDFVLAHWLNMWEDTVDPNILEKYPSLREQKEAVTSLPEIMEGIETRSKRASEFFGFFQNI